ncbi:MAG: hypothetical protein A3H33_14615 [Betaproteobacteria bacterium RIFCSPLOWO2_02_FULL_65_20]|nr:MAG: hypothetical protein A3H33_14615 [Betaproteobacteria bacterium RIFCSPLOWO2_02_FULL_65_20]
MSRSAATSSAVDTRRSCVWPPPPPRWPPERSRSVNELSVLMMTSSGATGTCADLFTLGRSITPVVTSGAVTMKMTSSTSITST